MPAAAKPSQAPKRRAAKTPLPRLAAKKTQLPGSVRGKMVTEQQRKVRVTPLSDEIAVIIDRVNAATPIEIVEIERSGIPGPMIKELSTRLDLPMARMFSILGIPKATAEKKAAANERVTGQGGYAAIGMLRLLGIAQEMAANSTSEAAKGFDAARWLGQWLEHPQPALGGRKPAEFVDTPSGVQIVARVLGAIESGAYQ